MKFKIEYKMEQPLIVEINTDFIDCEADIPTRIADEILREHQVCITKFHPECIKHYDILVSKIMCYVLQRQWCELYDSAEAYERMKEETVAKMCEIVSEAFKRADVKKKELLDMENRLDLQEKAVGIVSSTETP